MLRMDADDLRAFLVHEFPQVAGEIGIETLDEAGITLRLRVSDRHLRPGGTLGGPAIFLLGDVSAYCAILSRLGPKSLTVTTNAGIDFLRKPEAGRDLLCRAEILKLGRTLVVVDARFRSEGWNDVMARANYTYSIPPK